MEKEEIFRIFNACQPTVAQVKEYLEKISGDSPFDLIFRKDGKEFFSKKNYAQHGRVGRNCSR